MDFGSYVRGRRESRLAVDRRYSLRQTAGRIGIEPAYLSKIERGEFPPPSEATIRALATDLEEDADLLLALAGKVSSELQAIICERPQLFAALIRQLKHRPDEVVHRLVREIRDGNW